MIPALLMFLAGCETAHTVSVKTVGQLAVSERSPKILLMPLDVELSVLTAAGLTEPQAEWTTNAITHMQTALAEEVSDRGATLESYESVVQDPAATAVQMEKLHEAVGLSILTHHLGPLRLPAKNGAFDWTLGRGARALESDTDADYALFVFVRDSYASGGRVAMQIGMALLGASVSGGMQVGFASLVDLKSGDIVWFNRLMSSTGDLRKIEPARNTVKSLLDTLPGADSV
ncbi:hypothetical protein FKG94_16395 [Exilibacterium tricleocarpae]|uniref:Uncharacterized protein n=1 Tax=Exilibacterium tricleocarpae TaxID=2591008 RepID=A0A545TAE7_9GAMM|nr:hypothetical protein [Exilibacterium tricleocarpae]TQV74186.1 hypothetical protein FKG94_16395 [Exilibacterium tricleocarpae]